MNPRISWLTRGIDRSAKRFARLVTLPVARAVGPGGGPVQLVLYSIVLICIGVYVVHWIRSLRGIDDEDLCLVCGSPVRTDDAGDYVCRKCRFDAVRGRAAQFRPIVGLLRDLQEARRSLAVARRHYDWDRPGEARPHLDEASSLLRDVYREMPDLLGELAADVAGAAGEPPLEKLVGEIPVAALVVGVGGMFADVGVAKDRAEVKRTGLGRLDAWDATLVRARSRLARRLAAQMGGLLTQDE